MYIASLSHHKYTQTHIYTYTPKLVKNSTPDKYFRQREVSPDQVLKRHRQGLLQTGELHRPHLALGGGTLGVTLELELL
jgi:hypothetical protein